MTFAVGGLRQRVLTAPTSSRVPPRALRAGALPLQAAATPRRRGLLRQGHDASRNGQRCDDGSPYPHITWGCQPPAWRCPPLPPRTDRRLTGSAGEVTGCLLSFSLLRSKTHRDASSHSIAHALPLPRRLTVCKGGSKEGEVEAAVAPALAAAAAETNVSTRDRDLKLFNACLSAWADLAQCCCYAGAAAAASLRPHVSCPDGEPFM